MGLILKQRMEVYNRESKFKREKEREEWREGKKEEEKTGKELMSDVPRVGTLALSSRRGVRIMEVP